SPELERLDEPDALDRRSRLDRLSGAGVRVVDLDVLAQAETTAAAPEKEVSDAALAAGIEVEPHAPITFVVKAVVVGAHNCEAGSGHPFTIRFEGSSAG